MAFNDLQITGPDSLGMSRGRCSLPNGWQVSCVTGPRGVGVSGQLIKGQPTTWEVAIIRPNGAMLEDVLTYQSESQVETILRTVAML